MTIHIAIFVVCSIKQQCTWGVGKISESLENTAARSNYWKKLDIFGYTVLLREGTFQHWRFILQEKCLVSMIELCMPKSPPTVGPCCYPTYRRCRSEIHHRKFAYYHPAKFQFQKCGNWMELLGWEVWKSTEDIPDLKLCSCWDWRKPVCWHGFIWQGKELKPCASFSKSNVGRIRHQHLQVSWTCSNRW